MLKIDLYNIQFKEKIGNCQTSCVYPYHEDLNRAGWVMKCMCIKDSDEVNRILEDIISNIDSRHQCVVPIENYNIHKDDFDGWRIFIKMPRMLRSLKDIRDEYRDIKKIPIPFSEVVTYFYYLASSLEYLERHKIAHRNLKPSNVLFDQECRIYLSDMSTERFRETNTGLLANVRDSQLYMAPEIFYETFLNNEENTIKADAWSLGMIILDLCLKELKPVPVLASKQVKEKSMKNYIKGVGEIYPIGGKDLGVILRHLLKVDVSERRTFKFARRALEKKLPDVWGPIKEMFNYHPLRMLSSEEYNLDEDDFEEEDYSDEDEDDIDVAIGEQNVIVSRGKKFWKNINFNKLEKIASSNLLKSVIMIVFTLLFFIISFETEAEKLSRTSASGQNTYSLDL